MGDKIPTTQLNAWLLVATIPAAVSVVGQCGWATVLLAALACGTIVTCTLFYCKSELPRWLSMLELLWLVVMLGVLARESAHCWQKADAFPYIPIILMAISALAAQQGATRAGRTGAALIWLVLPILVIVLLAGTADGNLEWVRKEISVPDNTLITLLLIPSLALFLPHERKAKPYRISVILGLAATSASVMMDAVIGAQVAQSAANSMYEFSKSITLLGVAERFESLIACALTGGWFALFTLILSAIYHLSEKIFTLHAKWLVWIATIVATVLMCILPNNVWWTVFGCVIFWGILPAATQVIDDPKKIEKK